MISPAAGIIKLEKEFKDAGYRHFKTLLLDGGHGIYDEEVKKLKKIYRNEIMMNKN